MVAEILSVGTELLLGDIVNTNAVYIARELKELGIAVFFQGVVGDNRERLSEALKTAADRSDIIIMTGGLGPTDDDLTKETVAEFLGLEMELDEKSWESIKDYFAKRSRPITENNKKQAFFPKNSMILKNINGTAPGCAIDQNGKIFIMLPGPPEEMEVMFKNEVIPVLSKKSDKCFYSKTLRICGIGESTAADMLKDMITNQTNPTIAPYAKSFEVHLRVTASASDMEEAQRMVTPTINEIYKILGENIYGEDETTLEQTVVSLLTQKKLSIACAESCTGGLLSAKLISVPGASEIFKEGVITYSNESKISRLGVSPDTLSKYGAVSSEVATQMAIGVASALKADIGVSITGIAGPGGGNDIKPVGLVYIGIFLNGDVTVKEFNFGGSRDRIRNQSAVTALDLLRRILNGT